MRRAITRAKLLHFHRQIRHAWYELNGNQGSSYWVSHPEKAPMDEQPVRALLQRRPYVAFILEVQYRIYLCIYKLTRRWSEENCVALHELDRMPKTKDAIALLKHELTIPQLVARRLDYD